MMKQLSGWLIAATLCVLTACGEEKGTQSDVEKAGAGADQPVSEAAYKPGDEIPAIAYLEHNERYNPESVIPPQCYTKTDGVNNPCYVCHQTSLDANNPNIMNDGGLQGNYEFSDVGLTNSWKNLFKDRTEAIKTISDNDIQSWVNEDNYSEWLKSLDSQPSTAPAQAMRIANLAYPDQAFDTDGFAKDGSHWVTYNYKPFPSAFWPTNGSTGDAMIRLPAAFRELNGQYSKSVYLANLALVEMAIKQRPQLSVLELDEHEIGLDLDGDGTVSKTSMIQARATYIGDASAIEVAYMLYPEGTEFLHTVRYVGVGAQGEIYNAPRMKEVRYMRKNKFLPAGHLKSSYFLEAKEKHLEQMPQTVDLGDKGIDNRFGWTINAYIEDRKGQLRQQVHQELAFCNGCHKTVGSTIDQVFSFARKVEGARGWGYINLKAIKDVPNQGETQGEFLTYFSRVKGGDEFRQNTEMLSRWFKADGEVDSDKVQAVGSVYELITPSAERAWALNKSYRLIVDEQSYIYGRDAVLAPAANVLETVDDQVPPLQPQFRYVWDMRLDWGVAKAE
jgi:hypothetical protein